MKIKHHSIISYIFLVLLLLLAVLGTFYYQGYGQKQLIVIELTALLYFLWGVLIHYLEGDLHIKIVVEYLLIAVLAMIILRGAIIR